MMDTDMFLRAPVDPLALGVRRRDVVRVGARLRVRLGAGATWLGLGLG